MIKISPEQTSVVERTCSVAHSAIIKSNCRIEQGYLMPVPPLEAVRRHTTSQPYLPIVSHTGFATWRAVPSQPLLPHLETKETLSKHLRRFGGGGDGRAGVG